MKSIINMHNVYKSKINHINSYQTHQIIGYKVTIKIQKYADQ